MFQMKFCLKTFEPCSILFVSVLKCSILAIILFNISNLDASARGAKTVQGGRKKFQEGQLYIIVVLICISLRELDFFHLFSFMLDDYQWK